MRTGHEYDQKGCLRRDLRLPVWTCSRGVLLSDEMKVVQLGWEGEAGGVVEAME